MAGHEWRDWFEREEFIGQISDIRVQNLQVEREVVQKRTFTRWINLHLEKCNPPIEVHDLFLDIQDGHILMALLEELSGCKLLHGFKKSSHRIFRLNNIAKVLSFLEERNVKLVSIDAADVADGNSSIILGLIWNIILFFQIKELTGNIRNQFPSSSSLSSIPTSSDSDTSYCSTPSDERQPSSTIMGEHSKAIKKLLQWVQKRTRKYGVAVQDFGKSWTSGLAFLAVIKSIDTSLVDMRKALLRSPRENMEDAFRIAHFSLGIPRLLEPEDLTINIPDEHCIITYVSQFLEHFPGLEEPEESSHLSERSVSMGRLNLRDSDYYIRSGSHQSRVKERSYIFQRDYTQPPPKILISSVSEDRSAMSPLFRPVTARSWSSEDFLADSPHMDDISSSVVEDTKEPISDVSIANSPQLSCTQLLTDSSGPASVTGNSEINLPDSWVESEFGVMTEKYSNSTADSSFCDSGTAWDVYHATPVEVIALNEGLVPIVEDKAPDKEPTTELFIDDGIFSLSSLESTQEQNQSHPENKQVEVVKEVGVNHENSNQYNAREKEPYESETKVTKEVDSKQMYASILERDIVPIQQEPSFLPSPGAEDLLNTDETNQSQLRPKNELPPPEYSEELVKLSLEEVTGREPKCSRKLVNLTEDGQDHEGPKNGQIEGLICKSSQVKVENDCQKTDPLLQAKTEDPRDDSETLIVTEQKVVETPEKAGEGDLSDCTGNQNSIRTETSEVLTSTCPTNQEGASNNPEQSMEMNIPLISISSEPEEQNKEGTCNQERRAGHEEGHQPEGFGSKATNTDISSPQKPEELTCDPSDKDDTNLAAIHSCLMLENLKTAAFEQVENIENGLLDNTDKHDNRECSTVDTCISNTVDNAEVSEVKQECTFPHDNTLKDYTDKSVTAPSSMEIKAEEKNLDESFSPNEGAKTQQSTSNPATSESHGKARSLWYEPASVSRNMDFGRSSPTEDTGGDRVEPMDLFYPDKEEPMFTEPHDTDMQSWPSVFNVSALEPAPALADDPPFNPLVEDLRNEVDFIQEHDMVKTEQEPDEASENPEHSLSCGEKTGELWGDDVPAGGRDVSRAEQQSPGCVTSILNQLPATAENTLTQGGHIPPVLRHRKGACFTESMDSRSVVTAVTRRADNDDDSDFWRSENQELYLLLFLWLLLYSFWMLPQMDLKALPSLLLNLNR